MSSLNSVERTTMIELFSTFFDRLTSTHPQREMMLKSLYHFKSHLYSNDSMAAHLEELAQAVADTRYLTQQCPRDRPGATGYLSHQNEQKSPLKREGSQSRQKSMKKDENKENTAVDSRSRLAQQELSGRGQKTPTSKVIKNTITRSQEEDALATSTGRIARRGHEFDRDTSEQETTSSKAAGNQNELKQKTLFLLRAITNTIDTDEFSLAAMCADVEDPGKQRCSSGTGEPQLYQMQPQQMAPPQLQSQSPGPLGALGYSRMASGGEDRAVSTSQMALQMMRKCLRCNRDLGGADTKAQLSCFCANCKNF